MITSNREAFKRWYIYQLKTYDCDSAIYAMKYLVSRMELNTEQRYWLCWLFANTYNLPTAWVIFNEFPDFENADLDRITKWNEENWRRLPYQNDQKWLKGCLPEIFAAYRKLINGSQYEYFKKYNNDFDGLYKDIIKNFYKFGRYTAWFYMQALKEICHLQLEPTSMKFNDESSASPRAGLCFALDKPEWAEKHRKFSKDEIAYLECEASQLLQELRKEYNFKIKNISLDFFTLETALCSYKKLYRTRNGRYLGYYLDRFAKDIQDTSSKGWYGINWDLLWEARDEVLFEQLNNKKIENEKMTIFLEHRHFASEKYPRLKGMVDQLEDYFNHKKIM